MKQLKLLFITLLFTLFSTAAIADTKVLLQTTLGDIEIELDSEKAPITAKNFIDYVNSGYYDGLIFHRVIPHFMIQGGGADDQLKFKEPNAPIKNEAENGLKNDRGTIAMARTSAIDSATSQFFINVVDNSSLNYKSPESFGYAVFGKVINGMDIVDKIVNVPTQRKGPHYNVPVEPIYIIKATVEPTDKVEVEKVEVNTGDVNTVDVNTVDVNTVDVDKTETDKVESNKTESVQTEADKPVTPEVEVNEEVNHTEDSKIDVEEKAVEPTQNGTTGEESTPITPSESGE